MDINKQLMKIADNKKKWQLHATVDVKGIPSGIHTHPESDLSVYSHYYRPIKVIALENFIFIDAIRLESTYHKIWNNPNFKPNRYDTSDKETGNIIMAIQDDQLKKIRINQQLYFAGLFTFIKHGSRVSLSFYDGLDAIADIMNVDIARCDPKNNIHILDHHCINLHSKFWDV